MEVGVTRAVLQAIRTHAQAAAPAECCGLLLGRSGAISEGRAVRNVASDPRHRFEIDPQTLIDAHRAARSGGPDLIGYYHSHPDGPAAPSAADRAQASGDGRVWAIAGPDGITFWRDGQTGFVPLSCNVSDG